MAFVIISSIATVSFLLFQGIHILRYGNMRPFYDPRDFPPFLKTGARLARASLYMVPSVALFYILTAALFRSGVHRVFDWIAAHAVMVFGGLAMLAYGLTAVFRPDIILRSVQEHSLIPIWKEPRRCSTTLEVSELS